MYGIYCAGGPGNLSISIAIYYQISEPNLSLPDPQSLAGATCTDENPQQRSKPFNFCLPIATSPHIRDLKLNGASSHPVHCYHYPKCIIKDTRVSLFAVKSCLCREMGRKQSFFSLFGGCRSNSLTHFSLTLPTTSKRIRDKGMPG
jgi:hypothetical protein